MLVRTWCEDGRDASALSYQAGIAGIIPAGIAGRRQQIPAASRGSSTHRGDPRIAGITATSRNRSSRRNRGHHGKFL